MVGQKLPSVCRTLLVGILSLLLCVTTSSGLQCYRCSYSKLESGGSILGPFLSAFNALSNDDCKLSRDSDTTDVNIRSCPEPTDDSKVVKCVTLNGTATTSFSAILSDIKFHTLVRDCVEVDQSASEASDGCYQQSDSDDLAHSIVDEAFSTLSIGQVSFEGKGCYSSDDLATAGGATVTGTKRLIVLTMALVLAALN